MLSPELYIEAKVNNNFSSTPEDIEFTHSILKDDTLAYAIISTGDKKYEVNIDQVHIQYDETGLLVSFFYLLDPENEDKKEAIRIRKEEIRNPESITFGIPSENTSQQYQQAVYEFDDEQCGYTCTEYTITDHLQE
jgi:hypothetical protein